MQGPFGVLRSDTKRHNGKQGGAGTDCERNVNTDFDRNADEDDEKGVKFNIADGWRCGD